MKYSSLNLNSDNEVLDELIKIAQDNQVKVIKPGNKNNPKDMKDLYDVGITDDKTGKELIESAHPEKTDILKSYTTDGGLIENQTQQQETILSIVNRDPSNRIYKKTLASKELADELLIIAEEMDVRGNLELSAYADSLLQKVSWLPAIPLAGKALMVAVPAILGGLYALVHETDPVNFGVDMNLQSLVLAIKEYKDSKPASADVSVDVLSELNVILSGIYNTREQYKKLIDSLSLDLKKLAPVPSSTDQLKSTKTEQIAPLTQSKEANELVNKINKYSSMYINYVSSIVPELNRVKNYLTNYFKQTQDLAESKTGERGTLEKIWDKTTEYLSKAKRSDEENLLDALSVFIKSLNDDIKMRTAEKDQLISMLTTKINYDISEKFSENPSSKSPASV